jgi:hypothetical protein
VAAFFWALVDLDARSIVPSIHVPTLVMHRLEKAGVLVDLSGLAQPSPDTTASATCALGSGSPGRSRRISSSRRVMLGG